MRVIYSVIASNQTYCNNMQLYTEKYTDLVQKNTDHILMRMEALHQCCTMKVLLLWKIVECKTPLPKNMLVHGEPKVSLASGYACE